jgi:RHS repeat-associated protein
LILAIDALARTNRFFYDALNRRTNTVFADGSTASTLYDELGRRIAETDQNANTTRFGYDALGRLRFVTNALGKVTEHRYNELGQQTQQIDANHHATTFDYDQLGRRVLRTLPGGEFETYGYNVAGLMTGKRDFNGRFTTYTYDVMNRLEQKIPDAVTGEPAVSFAYNALGQRTNMVDASGSTRYGFDVRNRLVEKVKTWSAVGLSVALNYGYDAGGNLTNVVSSSPNGTVLAYEHDELSRLSAVNDARLGRTTYSYDAVGNLEGYALPNGVINLYTYDALNRLTNLTAATSSTGVAQYLYGLSPAGHRLSAAETVVRAGTPQTINRVFSYDRTYRLLGETISGAPSSGSAGYTYDNVGNRLSRSTSGFGSGILDPQSFSYDSNDRLNTDTYDNNGNTLFGAGFSQTQADRYDFENRLIERRTTIASVSRTVNITYDGDGNRVSKSVNGASTYYLVDDLNPTGYAQVLEELAVVGSQLLPYRLYTHGHDLLSQDQLFDASTNLVWSANFYGYDGHGSTRYLTDATGIVTDTYDYDAFGNLIAQTGTTPNLYLYSGEQYDSDLSLYYLRARYHNPQTGRFWSMDSFEGFGQDPASLHKYTYCGSDAVNCVDASGHSRLTELGVAIGIGIVAKVAISAIANSIAAYQYDVAFGDLYGLKDLGTDVGVGALEGAAGFGIGKAAFWAIGKAAPYLIRWTPEALLSGFNRASGLLQRSWAAAEAAWARLETAVVQGSEAAIRSAETALFQARAAITALSNLADGLALRIGLRPSSMRLASQAFRSAGSVGSRPVSVNQVQIALGKSGLSVAEYEIVHTPVITDPFGRKVFGAMSLDNGGNVVLGPSGRPLIQITDLGLSSMDEAVATIFHEVHHIRAALGTGIPSAEAHAEAFAQRMLRSFLSRITE